MPVISMFYGLIVSMYYLDTKKHSWPHIHVKYAEQEAVYQIPVIAWIEIHKEELMANWQLASGGNKVFLIDPLK